MSVPPAAVEAATSSGATDRQLLCEVGCRCRAGPAARDQPGHRHGVVDGGHRRTGRRGRARLRRHHGALPGEQFGKGLAAGRRDRAARDHARSDHPGRRRPPGDGRRSSARGGLAQLDPPPAQRWRGSTDTRRPRRRAGRSGHGGRPDRHRIAMLGILLAACCVGPSQRRARPQPRAPRAGAVPARRRARARARPHRRPAGAGDKGDVKLDINQWVGAEANVAVAERLLQQMGYKVTTDTLAEEIAWQGFEPARSTSSSRTGATRTSRRSTSPTRSSPRTPARTA